MRLLLTLFLVLGFSAIAQESTEDTAKAEFQTLAKESPGGTGERIEFTNNRVEYIYTCDVVADDGTKRVQHIQFRVTTNEKTGAPFVTVVGEMSHMDYKNMLGVGKPKSRDTVKF